MTYALILRVTLQKTIPRPRRETRGNYGLYFTFLHGWNVIRDATNGGAARNFVFKENLIKIIRDHILPFLSKDIIFPSIFSNSIVAIGTIAIGAIAIGAIAIVAKS